MNLLPDDVPAFEDGIYACVVRVEGVRHRGAMHKGPRPVFQAGPACEIHLLDTVLPELPPMLEVEVVEYLREIRDFPSPDALSQAIAEDVSRTRRAIPDSAL